MKEGAGTRGGDGLGEGFSGGGRGLGQDEGRGLKEVLGGEGARDALGALGEEDWVDVFEVVDIDDVGGFPLAC